MPLGEKPNVVPFFIHHFLPLSLAWCLLSLPSQRTLILHGVRVLSRGMLENDQITDEFRRLCGSGGMDAAAQCPQWQASRWQKGADPRQAVL
jgi:hypothetical protein